MKKYIKLLSILILTYIAVLILSCSAQTNMIFHPIKLDKDYKFNSEYQFEEVLLSTKDGCEINGLFFPDSSKKVILYFHGNAGSLDSWQAVYQNFQALGYNFFIIDYRGYGKSSGNISENGIYIDAQTAYDFLLKKGFYGNQIILYGRSIGSGVAVNLAANNNIYALILEAPFTNFESLIAEKYPYLLPKLYLEYEFDNVGKINNIKAPLLIIHGGKDETIPFKFGKELFDNYKGKKELLFIEKGGHNNLPSFPEFSNAIAIFIEFLSK
jgi:fermentation-respiration switch protein FrsA (DUF1100 family)